jgi:signal peptidase II
MNLLYPAVAATVFGTDMYLKNRMERELADGEVKELAKGKIQLRKLHNHGFIMGKLSDHPRLIAGLSLLLTAVISVWYLVTLGKKGHSTLKWGLSLLLGGAFCNTYDRLKRHFVVDYISFPVKWKRLAHTVFNISDFAILIGAMLVTIGVEGNNYPNNPY